MAHRLVALTKAPREIFGDRQVHSAADRQRKCALGFVAGNLAAAVRRAEENFAEGHKMIKAPQVQAGPGEVGLHVPADGCQWLCFGGGVEDKYLPVGAGATPFSRE